VLASDIAATLPKLRSEAEARMKSACTIRRWDGTYATDPDNGKVTKNTTVVYTGKCRIQLRSLTAQTPNAGETQLTIARPEIHVPMSVLGLRTGDVATITAVDPISGDADLVGRTLRIEVPFQKDDATARRLPCTEGGFDD
jgi:hypothetical protein